jgi:hypothetical protein
MSSFSRAADHAMGLELQLEELIEQRTRAAVQGRDDDARLLGVEIIALQGELAQAAEAAATAPPGPQEAPVFHDANELEADPDPT